MRLAVSLEDGLGLSGDRCMRDTPTVFILGLFTGYSQFSYLYLNLVENSQSQSQLHFNECLLYGVTDICQWKSLLLFHVEDYFISRF